VIIKTKHRRQGFVLISALLITSVLLLLLLPYASRVLTDFKLTSIVNNSTAAVNLAEAGAERAIWEIRYNNKMSDFTIPVSSFQPSTGAIIGEYEVAVTFVGNSATIISYGYVPSKSSYKTRKTIMLTYSISRAFEKGVAALNSITMSGQASTDSYDSSLGAYNLLLPDGTYNIGQEGDIASNGAITLGANTVINGDANPGEGYPFTGTPPVSGSYGTLQAPLVIDPIILPANISTVNDNGLIDIPVTDPPTTIFTSGTNNLVLSGTTQIGLPAGTYYFTSITMSGQSSINVTGATTIYIDAASGGVVDVNITGQGVVNNTGSPGNLIIYYTGSSIKLAGQASFSGAIYAPQATVTMSGQADIYGSIVCGSNVDSGQAAIHYDKNLVNVMPSFVSSKVTSWQEIQQ
jgi:hypothetical protein